MLSAIAIAALLVGAYFLLKRRQPIQLFPIEPRGMGRVPPVTLPDAANSVISAMHVMYRRTGYSPPWVGYLAFNGERWVGSCAFKRPAKDGRVEIAYYTFPQFEGKGLATQMARELVRIARQQNPRLTIVAQTLPETNASTRVLQKLGFQYMADVNHPEDGPVWEWHLIPAV